MIPVVSIVGKRNSGKTTLMVKLIAQFQSLGFQVGTIKHDAHDFEMDHPGKDTYQHFQAGAEQVMIAAAHKIALVRRTAQPLSLDNLVEHYFENVDIILTEGYKSGSKPKIEVFRSDIHDQPLCTKADDLIAFVSDVPLAEDVPLFKPHEIDQIVQFMLHEFGLSR
ncbi:molybdopterin-guanine dinucleotide biosynthesis protein B [candidate division CSSED10-310 bacterium]|uniref:Molybdopterin-guanine dinucleotide biosynthesis protein B n=1 Tax=candidate division CSSED10-310 bacterium TaxID=2855610 RepID=A0ABV6YYA2_UNCC1